jgi:hypothetical protein
MSLSSAGDLSTMYDIHACLPVGQNLFNAGILTSNIPSGLDLRTVQISSAIASRIMTSLVLTARIQRSCSRPILCGLSLTQRSLPQGPWCCQHTRQLFLQVLEVLVSKSVNADQGTALGVTCTISVSMPYFQAFAEPYRCSIPRNPGLAEASFLVGRDQGGHTCIWWPKSWEMLALVGCVHNCRGDFKPSGQCCASCAGYVG